MNFFLAQGKLHPTPPFDFNKSLHFLKISTPARSDQFVVENALVKTISINGQAIMIRIDSLGSVNRPELQYRLLSEQPINEEVKFAALDRASFFLSLYDNLRPFYDIGEKDNHFSPVLKSLYGYHQVKFSSPFENACWAVLIRQNPLALARQMKDDLVTCYGSSIVVNGREFRAFPEPPHLSPVDEKELARVLENEAKARRIKSLARSFEDVNEEFLRRGSYGEVKEWLQNLEGLDAWGAAFVLLRGLGRMEEEPIIDRKLAGATHRFYGLLNQDHIPSIAEQYGQWQGYWSHYLRVAA